MSVAGCLLEGPARSQHDENDESTETDVRRVLFIILSSLAKPRVPSFERPRTPTIAGGCSARRFEERATTVPTGRAAKTRCRWR